MSDEDFKSAEWAIQAFRYPDYHGKARAVVPVDIGAVVVTDFGVYLVRPDAESGFNVRKIHAL